MIPPYLFIESPQQPWPTEPFPSLSYLTPHWGTGSVRFPIIFMSNLTLLWNCVISVCLSNKDPNAFRSENWPNVLLYLLGHLALPWTQGRYSITPEWIKLRSRGGQGSSDSLVGKGKSLTFFTLVGQRKDNLGEVGVTLSYAYILNSGKYIRYIGKFLWFTRLAKMEF